MRNAVIEELENLSEADERVVLLTGDLGFMVLENFERRFPDRFINCGVSEQNMVGVATGLAEAGFHPFVYSIATFATMRPYEFIRNGPALHELPVHIIGVEGGFDYGHNGVTHFALEDYAVMRTQPRITTVVPADAQQGRAAIRQATSIPGPAYFRISKHGAPLAGLNGRFELGALDVVREGPDAAIFAIGAISHEAIAAASLLAEDGIDVTVGVVSSFNPSPIDDIARLCEQVPVALAVEAHYRDGGLGSLVAETIAERGLSCRLLRASVARMPSGRSGSQQYLEASHALNASALVEQLEQALALAG